MVTISQPKGSAKILVFNVVGVIKSGSPIARLLRLHLFSPQPLAGVILNIDCGGGSLSVAQEMVSLLGDLPDSTKVATVIGESALSAGYYLALAGHRIFSQPASHVGAVGSRCTHVEVGGLLRTLGIRVQTIANHVNKQPLLSAERWSREQTGMYQAIVDDMHAQFVRAVQSRRMTDNSDGWGDSQIVSGRRASELGLVDAFGGLKEAIAFVAAHCPDSSLDVEFVEEPDKSARAGATGLGAILQGINQIIG